MSENTSSAEVSPAALSVYAQTALACYQAHFGQTAQLVQEIAAFYGHAVILSGEAGDVVVKLGWQAGRAAREVIGLARLQPHSPAAMPQILLQSQIELNGKIVDLLMLNRLPGVAPWHVAKPWAKPQLTAEQVVAVLLAWHAVSDARGFELPDGQFSADLIAAFEAWTLPLHDYVQSPASPFTPQQKAAYQRLWQERSRLLAPLAGMPSSLVHDDPHAGNFLFDEHTGELLAALDPCDVAFRHREQDIFHLADVAPELQLLETYLQHHAAPEGFAARRWFFSLWDDAKHSRNLAWYDEAWFNAKFANLAILDKSFAEFGAMMAQSSQQCSQDKEC
ncbi:phosphotransferase [Chitinibacter bivalviorum]|uniref:Phosphotransferase n=1 Tax=Chitinibacter bivalviorum TaxID=2739434 RepID=A0A7H9BKR4_9NEIS|nr:phosphotransferase [Chitinibacter bivalviorum]QLG89163.1 phosphotransferase [Chitinibacter bivalviorum]